jgi:DhnA family fructose-bisphosphate aldolase class Ia
LGSSTDQAQQVGHRHRAPRLTEAVAWSMRRPYESLHALCAHPYQPIMTREENLDLFFKEGRTVILPIDHGVALPVRELGNPAALIERVNPFVDGYVMNLGVALRTADLTQGKGICLRTDVYNTRTQGPGAGSIPVYGVDTAEIIGAHAVMNMLYPGAPDEVVSMQACAEIIQTSLDSEVPVILETLPYGLGQTDHYTVEKVRFAVRLAAEMGSDVVKTVYPPGASMEEFRDIVQQCFVPVIVLGGAPMEDDAALFMMVENAIRAGASGIAIGRNVWQHPNPTAVARSLWSMVHQEASALEALALMKEPLR